MTRRLLCEISPAASLALAAPHNDGILIRPGETFSFWRLVGEPSSRRGYQMGAAIVGDHPEAGIGGGLCQPTNLLHWMALHSPLTLEEHRSHFGCGSVRRSPPPDPLRHGELDHVELLRPPAAQ